MCLCDFAFKLRIKFTKSGKNDVKYEIDTINKTPQKKVTTATTSNVCMQKYKIISIIKRKQRQMLRGYLFSYRESSQRDDIKYPISYVYRMRTKLCVRSVYAYQPGFLFYLLCSLRETTDRNSASTTTSTTLAATATAAATK